MEDVIHLMVDDLFDCIRAVAGTSGSCIVLAAIIISSCKELFEIIECLFVFWFFSPFLTVFCE